MIKARIFLKINISASKKFFNSKRIFVFLNQFNVKSRLGLYSFRFLDELLWIFDIKGKASLTVNQSSNVIRVKHCVGLSGDLLREMTILSISQDTTLS